MQEDWVTSLAMHTPKKEKRKEKQVIPAHPAYSRRKPAATCPAPWGSHARKSLTAALAALPTSPSKDQRAPDGDWHRGQRQGKSRPLKGWIDAINEELGWRGSGETEVVHFCKRPTQGTRGNLSINFYAGACLGWPLRFFPKEKKYDNTFLFISANHPSGSNASASVRRTAPSLGLEHILQSPLRADVLELVLVLLFITIEQVLQNLL